MAVSLMLRFAGTVLFALSLLFVGYFAATNWPEEINFPLSLLCLSSLIYGLSHITTTASWLTILRALCSPLPLREGATIALVSQVGKYLPGNIAHHVGRAALAKRLNVPIKVSAASTGIEVASAILAAAIVGAFAVFMLPDVPAYVWVAILLVGGAMLLIAFTRYRAALISVPFLTVGLVFTGYSFQLLHGGQWAISAYALAWLLGFLVPGAPAGLGVREAALIAMLGPDISAIAVHRLLTAAVDAIVGLLAYLLMGETDVYSRRT